MLRSISLLLLVITWLTSTGCDRITGFIEQKLQATWPSIDEAVLRKQVEMRLIEQVASVSNPNSAAFLPADPTMVLLEAQLAKAKGIRKNKFALSDDLIIGLVEFQITEGDSFEDMKKIDGLKDYRIEGSFRIAATPLIEVANNRIRFMFAFTQIDLSKAEVSGHPVPEPLVNSVVTLLTKYLANINGVLNAECAKPQDQQIINISPCITVFPKVIASSVDLKESLQSSPTTMSVTAEKVNLSLENKGAALAITKDGLFLIARLSGVAFGSGSDTAKDQNANNLNGKSARDIVVSRAQSILGKFSSKEFAVGIRKELPARALEYVAAAAQLGFTSKIDGPKETFDTEVRLAKRPEFQCSRISCSRSECRKPDCYSRTEQSCTSDRGEIGKIINKACSTVVNVTCEGGRAANDLICNTVEELSKTSCDIGEELRKVGCEGNKIFVDKVLGRIGNISGDYRLEGTYSVTLDNAEVTQDLEKITTTFTANASARASGSLKFTPMDQGHLLACIAQWKEGFSVDVMIPETRRKVSASRSNFRHEQGVGLKLTYALETFEVSGRVSPAPFSAVFIQHPHLQVNCP